MATHLLVIGLLVYTYFTKAIYAGYISSRKGVYNSSHSNNFTNEKFTGLYIVPGENYSFLCDFYGVSPQKINFSQGFHNSSIWYSLEDQVYMPLRLSYENFPRVECGDSRRMRNSDYVMSEIMSISITNSVLTELRNNTFVRFKKLRRLVLSNNFIETISPFAFSHLSKLEVLDLSDNRFTSLDLSYFPKFLAESTKSTTLSYVNLSSHYLESIECSSMEYYEAGNTSVNESFPSMNTMYDLSFSNIAYISPSCSHVIEKYYKNITININGNPVNCNCSVSHNSTSGATVTDLHDCACPEKKKYADSHFKFTLSELCLFVSLFISFLCLVVVIVVFVYLKRGKETRLSPSTLCNGSFCTNMIQYIEGCSDRESSVEQKSQSSNTFTYVYIVASAKDSAMVEMFVEELETKRHIPVVFKERDEIPGYFKLELFRKWLNSSKRTIFLINSNFLKDTDCTQILNQAKAIELSQRRVIIVIIKLTENLHPMEMLSVNEIFVQSICLDYSPSKEFWDKLMHIIYNNEMHVHISNTT